MVNIREWLRNLAFLSLFSAAASAFAADDMDDLSSPVDDDPLSGFNHVMYEFNHGFDTVILKPVTEGYRYIVPEIGREMVSNAVENIYTPVVFFNSVLQGDPQNSFASFWRFAINTTFGIGGMFDVASEAGLKNRNTDFGQTLAMYGVDSGPYLVLPVIGPSSLRDGTGRLADALMNPFNYIDNGTSAAIWTATAIDARSRNMKLIDDIYAVSLDPYITFKSAYEQHRAADIARAKASRQKALEKAGIQ